MSTVLGKQLNNNIIINNLINVFIITTYLSFRETEDLSIWIQTSKSWNITHFNMPTQLGKQLNHNIMINNLNNVFVITFTCLFEKRKTLNAQNSTLNQIITFAILHFNLNLFDRAWQRSGRNSATATSLFLWLGFEGKIHFKLILR